MSALRALTEMEYKRYRLFSFREHPGVILCVMAVLVVGGVVFIKIQANASVYGFLVTLIYSSAVACLSLIGPGYLATTSSEKEWWISFPQPRLSLILSKYIATILLACKTLCVFSLTVLIVYVIAWTMEGSSAQPTTHLVVMAAAWVILNVLGTPALVALGMSVFWLTNSWRSALIPLLMLTMIFWGGLVAAIAPNHTPAPLFPAPIFKLGLWMMVVGWPVGIGAIFLAVKGVRRIGLSRFTSPQLFRSTDGQEPIKEIRRIRRLRPSSPTGVSGDDASGSIRASIPERRGGAFRSLIAIEGARYRWLGTNAKPAVRWTAYSVLLLSLIGGYLAGLSNASFIIVPCVLVFIVIYVFVLYSQVSRVFLFQKGYGIWWIAMPQPRLRLVMSRVVSMVLYLGMHGGMVLCLLMVGLGTHELLTPVSHHVLVLLLTNLLHTVVFGCICIFSSLLIFEIYPALLRSSVLTGLSIFLFPIVYFMIIHFAGQWIFAGTPLASPPTDFWRHMLDLALIGIPLGIVCVNLGARNLHYMLRAYSGIRK